MIISRRTFAAGLAACGLAVSAGAASAASAAFAPTKPVTLVVPYGAGGGTDLVFRTLVQIINDKKLGGQNWVIVNREGGAGMNGMNYVLGIKGDEHTLMALTPGHIVIPKVQGLSSSWKDLTPVANLVTDPQILVATQQSGFKSIDDVLAAIKGGREVRFAGGAIGQDDHLTHLLFQNAAGKKVTYVAFKGGGDMRQALLGGHVEAGWLNPAEISGLTVKDGGTLTPVAVALDKRLEDLPDVPTLKEKGVDVVYDMFFRSLVAPGGVSPEVVDFYVSVIDKAVAEPEWKAFVKKIGSLDDYKTKDAFKTALEGWDAKFNALVPELQK
jgi:putative tricarboxylic transport membrane protein